MPGSARRTLSTSTRPWPRCSSIRRAIDSDRAALGEMSSSGLQIVCPGGVAGERCFQELVEGLAVDFEQARRLGFVTRRVLQHVGGVASRKLSEARHVPRQAGELFGGV